MYYISVTSAKHNGHDTCYVYGPFENANDAAHFADIHRSQFAGRIVVMISQRDFIKP